MNGLLQKILIPFFTLATIGVNALATIIPLGGRTTGEISDSFANFFVPAGTAFSIWSLIYTGLLAFSIYQLNAAENKQKFFKSILPAYIISSLANMSWILLWHYGFISLSIIAMLTIFASLLYIFKNFHETDIKETKYRFLAKYPFQIYFGWITVATIVNIVVVLLNLGVNEIIWDGVVWSMILGIIAGVIGGIVTNKFSAIAYGSVIVWALFWIIVKFYDQQLIVIGASTGISLTLIIGLYNIVLKSFKKSE